jgi:APA family basic amino acid/polyamine antiporter
MEIGWGHLFATKPYSTLVQQASAREHGLKRSLGALDLVMLGVGAIIGVGIFVLTGQAAAEYAGPAIVLSFLLAGLACAFSSVCYSEMAAMIPIAGSAYTYSYATMGELVAWIIGWDLILEYSLAGALVSVGWSGYVVSLLRDVGVDLPASLTTAPFAYDTTVHAWRATGSIVNVPAAAIVLLITVLLVIGIRESATVATALVFVKVAVVLVFIGVGAMYLRTENWHPFLPPNAGAFGRFGWSGVLRGAGVVFVAYIGFDAVSTAAQETRHPQRDMPVGILGSLAVCTVLYVLVAGVLTGIVPYTSLDVPDPIAVGINVTGMEWLRIVVKIGALAGLSSVILVMLMGQPRILWSMAVDGLLPDRFATVHPRFRTPYVTTLVTGTVVAIAGSLLPIDVLAELQSIGTLLAFVLVCGGVWVLRHTRPDLPRPFETPWVPVVPLLGMATCLYLMYGLPPETWVRLAVWMVTGLAVYFAYGRRKSKLRVESRQSSSSLRTGGTLE